jgi:general nucleoside transport system permease protein
MLALEGPRLRATATAVGLAAAALALFSLVLLGSGKSPLDTFASLLGSTLGNAYGLGEVFVKLIPLLLAALAVTLPARLGLVNVGGEGQLHLGALFAAATAVAVGAAVPGWVALPLGMLAGMAGGAAWALVPALLRARGWLNETISTLLLNYVAVNVVDWFVYGPLRDPDSANVPQTQAFARGFLWPTFTGRVHLGLVLGLCGLALAAVVLSRTRWGYEIRAIGGNPVAAHRHGLPLAGATVAVLCVGGALAGLAGTGEIMAIQGRLRPHFSADYGYLGFLISWLAGHRPLRILVAAFLVAAIATGGDSLQLDQGLPSATVNILMALLLMGVLAREGKRVG